MSVIFSSRRLYHRLYLAASTIVNVPIHPTSLSFIVVREAIASNAIWIPSYKHVGVVTRLDKQLGTSTIKSTPALTNKSTSIFLLLVENIISSCDELLANRSQYLWIDHS